MFNIALGIENGFLAQCIFLTLLKQKRCFMINNTNEVRGGVSL